MKKQTNKKLFRWKILPDVNGNIVKAADLSHWSRLWVVRVNKLVHFSLSCFEQLLITGCFEQSAVQKFTSSCFKQSNLREQILFANFQSERGAELSIQVEILPLAQHLFGSFPPALLSDGGQEMMVALLPEKSRNSPNVKQSSEPNDLWPALRILVQNCWCCF